MQDEMNKGSGCWGNIRSLFRSKWLRKKDLDFAQVLHCSTSYLYTDFLNIFFNLNPLSFIFILDISYQNQVHTQLLFDN